MRRTTRFFAALATALGQGAALDLSLAEQIKRSLVSPLAKVWIKEDQDIPRTPELII